MHNERTSKSEIEKIRDIGCSYSLPTCGKIFDTVVPMVYDGNKHNVFTTKSRK